jgi:AraC-like DNA-binding protein
MIFPYNTYLCSIPLDFASVPTHWHDEMEIIYIKKGRGNVTVDFSTYAVTGPSLVVILPGQLHAIASFGQETMEYENIIFHPDMLIAKNLDSCNRDYIQPLLRGQIAVPTVFTPDDPNYADVVSPIDACDEISGSKPQGYELYIKSMLFSFFFVLCNRCKISSEPQKNRRSLDGMRLVTKYVEHHYAEKITIAKISDLVGFSESHFMRYFKNTMGTSFIDYLKDYRLAMAARLLQASDSSILEIAEDVGFESLSYFNRAFKKRYGMTPTQFRKN